jgi:hypothetical protein
VYILIVEAIERRKTGVEYAEINGITVITTLDRALRESKVDTSTVACTVLTNKPMAVRSSVGSREFAFILNSVTLCGASASRAPMVRGESSVSLSSHMKSMNRRTDAR